MGAIIHELGHGFGLPHVTDPESIMARGFDHFNRVFISIEAPRLNAKPFVFSSTTTFTLNQTAYWDKDSAKKMMASPWFQSTQIAPERPWRQPARFYFNYQNDTRARHEFVRSKNGDWVETLPDGSTRLFHHDSRTEVQGNQGTVIRDGDFYIFIPDSNEKGSYPTLMRKRSGNSAQWQPFQYMLGIQ